MIDLRHLLHANVSGHEPGRGHRIIHASELTSVKKEFCPREVILLDVLKVKPSPQFVPTSLRVTFDYGDFLQWSVNNVYLRKQMWGDWRCVSCGRLKTKGFVPTKPCHLHKTGQARCRYEYKEPRITDTDTKASAGIDGAVLDGEYLRVMEIKSEVKDEFKKLSAPRAEHRLRGMLYLAIIARTEWARKVFHSDHMNILYVCKGYGIKDSDLFQQLKAKGISDFPFTPFKEWRVKRDDKQVSKLLKKARVVRVAREKGKMPNGVCNSAMCKRARECPVRKECWSGKFHVTLNWG